MIPAGDPPFVAVFETEEGEEEKRVIAWDDVFGAMVVDTETGELVTARNENGFKCLREAPELRHVVGVIPAGDWRVRWQDGGTWVSEPLMGWLVFSDGGVMALEHAGEGKAMRPDDREEGQFEIYNLGFEAPDGQAGP